MDSPPKFKKLFQQEHALLCQADNNDFVEVLYEQRDVEPPGPAGEPWIRNPLADRVEPCVFRRRNSQRQFNLGVLKGLNELGVLEYVDYLSTVSGDGYIGA